MYKTQGDGRVQSMTSRMEEYSVEVRAQEVLGGT
jgi:hypothetical protein